MKRLLSTIAWDLKLQAKYYIITAALVVTAVYIVIFKLIIPHPPEKVIISLIFSDPTLLGFLFTGLMVLFEKDANSLQALIVTPIKIWQYLWARAISLTLLAAVCSCAIVIGAHGFDLNFIYLLLAVALSSVFFVFIGFVGVSRARSINQYLTVIPILLFPLCLPFFGFLNILRFNLLFLLIPTQASLYLFEAAFNPTSAARVTYSVAYLLLWTILAYFWAKRRFEKYIVQGRRDR